MQKIDAHQHFWNFEPVKDDWINDKMKAIRRDFTPADLKPLLEESNIEGCVAVQADQSEKETAYLLALAEQHEFINGVVGWVDLRQDNIKERLKQYSKFKKLKGFRHVLQGETDRALIIREDFKRGISFLSKYNYTYDLLIFPDQLLFARELALRFPEQKFVLDHIAKPDIRKGSSANWAEDLKALAACKNVSCKISGMVTEARWKKWKPADIIPYLDTAVEAFGPNRIMFGSDWPVCLIAAGYRDVVQLAQDYFAGFSPSEQEAFWGGNAIKFYDL